MSFQVRKSRGETHRGHRQAAVPVEKGVRHGYTEALSGTAVLGGEGHFSLLDTVGDREGRSSIGGLLGGGQNRRQGGGESRERSAQAVLLWNLNNTTEGCPTRDGCLVPPKAA